jgi:hypothetical protein
MKDLRDPLINRYRLKMEIDFWKNMGAESEPDARYAGAFVIPYYMGSQMTKIKVIAASGGGWDHISVSIENRCPNWDEMEYIARMFFREDEVAVQYHIPRRDHINIHPYVLHWWRPHSKIKKIPMPPKAMV